MPKTLNDNRKYVSMSEGEADGIFAKIATLSIEIEKVSAAYDKKISLLQAECQERLADSKTQLANLDAELSAYISAHPERFVKPRARKIAQGRYGLRDVSNLVINSENSIILHADLTHLPLYTTTTRLDLPAVKKAIADGHLIPGAEMQYGERTFYTVDKSLLDEARKG